MTRQAGSSSDYGPDDAPDPSAHNRSLMADMYAQMIRDGGTPNLPGPEVWDMTRERLTPAEWRAFAERRREIWEQHTG